MPRPQQTITLPTLAELYLPTDKIASENVHIKLVIGDANGAFQRDIEDGQLLGWEAPKRAAAAQASPSGQLVLLTTDMHQMDIAINLIVANLAVKASPAILPATSSRRALTFATSLHAFGRRRCRRALQQAALGRDEQGPRRVARPPGRCRRRRPRLVPRCCSMPMSSSSTILLRSSTSICPATRRWVIRPPAGSASPAASPSICATRPSAGRQYEYGGS